VVEEMMQLVDLYDLVPLFHFHLQFHLSKKMYESQVREKLRKRDATHGFSHAQAVVRNISKILLEYPFLSPELQQHILILGWIHDFRDPKYPELDSSNLLPGVLNASNWIKNFFFLATSSPMLTNWTRSTRGG
jgi:hypothetical protein